MSSKSRRRVSTFTVLLLILLTGIALVYFGRQDDRAAADNIKTSAQAGNGEDSDTKINDVDISVYDYKKAAFAQEINKRKEEAERSVQNSDIEGKIKEYLGSKVTKIGMAYYDIKSGKGFSINGDKYYTAASTVKVAMNMVLFDMVKEGKANINESLKYTSADYEAGTGILQGKDKTKPIPLLTLSDYSIIYSDNIATNMIMRRIGRTEMKRRFGLKVGHSVPVDQNVVTPNEELTFLKQLYNNKDNNEYYPRLINIMKTTTFHDRLDKYVPQDIVAHKIGNYGSFVNDVGIIYAPNPYVVAVYTDGLADANETIAQISKIIYEAHK